MAKIWTLDPNTLTRVDLDGEVFRLPEPATGALQDAGVAALFGLWVRRRSARVAVAG